MERYLARRSAEARYASFDYCYNHFQSARERGELDSIADGEDLMLSSLHLGFYLASWGMMRGSGELLQRSIRELLPVVRTIAAEPSDAWIIDVCDDGTYASGVLALYRRIQAAFTIRASETLVTKTMLGVFGFVPAFDRYFRLGFGCRTVCTPTLDRIAQFYESNQGAIDAVDVHTLDALTGLPTDRRYPRGKIIDMIFFQSGFELPAVQIGQVI